jgi:hypothetical protein
MTATDTHPVVTTAHDRSLDVALPQAPMARFRRLVILGVAAGGDAINFTQALGVVAADLGLWQLWSVVGALTLATVGLMHFAGVSARKRRLAGLGRWASAPVLTLGALWLALGLSAFVLRLAPVEPATGGLVLRDAAAAASAAAPQGPGWAQIGLALLMLCLFLATGGLAAWVAYNGHDPQHERLSRVAFMRRWARLVRGLARRWQRRLQRRDARRLRRLRRAVRRSRSLHRTLAALRVRAVRRREAAAAEKERRRQDELEQRRLRRDEEDRQRQEREREAERQRQEREREAQRQRRERRLAELRELERHRHDELVVFTGAETEVADRQRRHERAADLDRQLHRAEADAVRAAADDLRDYARLRLAAVIGDPAATTALTAPHLPRPVVHRVEAS